MDKNLEKSPEPSKLYPDILGAVKRGFMVMIACNMEFIPTTDELKTTAEVLAKCLIEEGITDPVQVQATLEKMGRTYQKWPSTALIISLLKPAKEDRPHAEMYQLAAPVVKEKTDDDWEKGRAHLATLRRKLGHGPALSAADEAALIQQVKDKMAENDISI